MEEVRHRRSDGDARKGVHKVRVAHTQMPPEPSAQVRRHQAGAFLGPQLHGFDHGDGTGRRMDGEERVQEVQDRFRGHRPRDTRDCTHWHTDLDSGGGRRSDRAGIMTGHYPKTEFR